VLKKKKPTTEDTEEHREKTLRNYLHSGVKPSVKRCALCGKKEKPTTEDTEEHKERTSVKLCVLCGEKN
jgi:hypothetical protein